MTTVAAGAALIRTEMLPPSIHPNPGQIDDPFAATFTVQSPRKWLDMRDVKFTCLLISAAYPRGGLVENDGFAWNGPVVTLKPNHPLQYACPVNRIMNIGPPIAATIRVSVFFRDISGSQNFTSEQFNWDGGSRSWSEGQIVY